MSRTHVLRIGESHDNPVDCSMLPVHVLVLSLSLTVWRRHSLDVVTEWVLSD